MRARVLAAAGPQAVHRDRVVTAPERRDRPGVAELWAMVIGFVVLVVLLVYLSGAIGRPG